MKKILMYIPLLLALFGFAACGSDDNDEVAVANLSQNSRGTFVDPRDGNEYHYIKVGNLDWTTDNARFDTGDDATRQVYATVQIPGDYGATTDARTIARYGYLYSFEGAQQAAPEGWRVPTDEDWQNLEKELGMTADEASRTDWRGAGVGTVLHASEGLNMPFGGFYDAGSTSFADKFYYKEAMGYYWTASSPSEGLGYLRKIMYNNNRVYRYTTSQNNMLSVRFVRDAQ